MFCEKLKRKTGVQNPLTRGTIENSKVGFCFELHSKIFKAVIIIKVCSYIDEIKWKAGSVQIDVSGFKELNLCQSYFYSWYNS